ncbi:MAG: MATE family efflux transporter [Gemmatimonadota bacterium]
MSLTSSPSLIDPTRGSIRAAVLRLSGPAVAGSLLQILFNLADVFWVGRGLGSAALAGISTAGFTVWLLLAVAETAEVGLTAVESRLYGQGRREEAARSVFDALGLSAIMAASIAVAGLVGLPWLFQLMGTPPEVTVQGTGYLTVYLAGAPIVFAYFVMTAAFRAAGDTRTPLYLLALSVGLNVLLDPLLILGIGPFPRLEIQGAALATLLTRGLGCGLGLLLLRRRGLVRPGRLRGSEMKRMVRIGFPVAVGGSVFSVVSMILTRVTSRFGTPALAALGVGHRVESVSFMVCIGFGLAAATAVGQNLGAGKPERAASAGRTATAYALLATGSVGLVFFLFPGWVIGLFSSEAAVISAGSSYLRIVALAQIFMALHLVLEIGMEGAGYTLVPMISSVSLTVLRLPLAVLLSGIMGLTGIWWTIGGTSILRGVAVVAIWRAGWWSARRL